MIQLGVTGKDLGGAANAQTIPGLSYKLEEDDNEVITTLMDALGSVAIASNANTQTVRGEVSVLKNKIANSKIY